MQKNLTKTFSYQHNITSKVVTLDSHKLITELQKKVANQEKLSLFWNLTRSINQYDKTFVKFDSCILANRAKLKSQLFQDLFVLFMLHEKRWGILRI